jgi:hypothetical protein
MSTEYLKRDDVLNMLNRFFKELEGNEAQVLVSDIKQATIELPTATPVKEGYWIEKQETLSWCEDDVDIFYECSACGCCVPFPSDFCPDCGTIMLEESTNE